MSRFLIISSQKWPLPAAGADQFYQAEPGKLQHFFALHPKLASLSGVLLTSLVADDEWEVLQDHVDAYRVVAFEQVRPQTAGGGNFFRQKQVKQIKTLSPDQACEWLKLHLFDGQSGIRMDIQNFVINNWYQGPLHYHGSYAVKLAGDFGPAYRPLGSFTYSFWQDKPIHLWPEFIKGPGVHLRITIYEFKYFGHEVIYQHTFDETELDEVLEVPIKAVNGHVCISYEVKGAGELTIGTLHSRWSRQGWGYFLPGGERILNPDRGEVMVYFNPGNLRPPLNIYFSGYRTLEGFEAYNMMRDLQHPFMLITDTRLDGGAFYLEDQATQDALIDRIKKALAWLGFKDDQVVFSGLSMGTTGALYYGSFFKPAAFILGKPIINLGQMALSEKQRFNAFPTSLDLLRLYQRYLGADQATDDVIKKFDQIILRRFQTVDLSKSKFMVAYMKQDDYDQAAYQSLIECLEQQPVFPYLISRGFNGYHTEQMGPVSSWFKHQFHELMQTFGE